MLDLHIATHAFARELGPQSYAIGSRHLRCAGNSSDGWAAEYSQRPKHLHAIAAGHFHQSWRWLLAGAEAPLPEVYSTGKEIWESPVSLGADALAAYCLAERLEAGIHPSTLRRWRMLTC